MCIRDSPQGSQATGCSVAAAALLPVLGAARRRVGERGVGGRRSRVGALQGHRMVPLGKGALRSSSAQGKGGWRSTPVEPPTDVRAASGELEAAPVDARVWRHCTPWAKAP
eukprot:14999674-Alexandrium_andersonii.AAC.1